MSKSTTPGSIAEQTATLKRKFQELLQAVPTEPSSSRDMLLAIGKVDLANADSGLPAKHDDTTTKPTEGQQVKARSKTASKKTKPDTSPSLGGAARSSGRKNKGRVPRRYSDNVSGGRVDSIIPSSPFVPAGLEERQSLVMELKVPREELIAKMMEDKEMVEVAETLLSLRYGEW